MRDIAPFAAPKLQIVEIFSSQILHTLGWLCYNVSSRIATQSKGASTQLGAADVLPRGPELRHPDTKPVGRVAASWAFQALSRCCIPVPDFWFPFSDSAWLHLLFHPPEPR